ncbi:hypothetical protein PSYAR_31491, partial [Pseudomonas syringae pv. aceris str. M302273]
ELFAQTDAELRHGSRDNDLFVQIDAELQHGVEIIVPHAPAWECSSRR